jgi:hypothetical protein
MSRFPSTSAATSPRPLTKNQLRIQELQSQHPPKPTPPLWDLVEINSLSGLSDPILSPTILTKDLILQIKQKIPQLSQKTFKETSLSHHRVSIEIELRGMIQLKRMIAQQMIGGGGTDTGGRGTTGGGGGGEVAPSERNNDIKNWKIMYRQRTKTDLRTESQLPQPLRQNLPLKNDMSTLVAEGEEIGREGVASEGVADDVMDEDEELEEEECGSDSDPSGDELPSMTLFHNKSFITLLKENQPQLIKNIKSLIKKKKRVRRVKTTTTATITTFSGDDQSTRSSSSDRYQHQTSSSAQNRRQTASTAPHRQALTFAQTLLGTNSINSSPVLTMRKAPPASSSSTQKKSLRVKTFSIDSQFDQKPSNSHYPRRHQTNHLMNSSTSGASSVLVEEKQSSLPRPVSSHGRNDRSHEGSGDPSLLRREYTSSLFRRPMVATAESSGGSSASMGPSGVNSGVSSSETVVSETRKLRSHIPLTVKDMTLIRDTNTRSMSAGVGHKMTQLSTSPIAIMKSGTSMSNTREILTACPTLKSGLSSRSPSAASKTSTLPFPSSHSRNYGSTGSFNEEKN